MKSFFVPKYRYILIYTQQMRGETKLFKYISFEQPRLALFSKDKRLRFENDEIMLMSEILY